MAKILRRRGPGIKTALLPKAPSKHSAEARRLVTSKQRVKRLMARDPARGITQDAIANQFTDNENPKYLPTGVGPQSVKRVEVPDPPRGSTKGHAKVIRRPKTRWKRR